MISNEILLSRPKFTSSQPQVEELSTEQKIVNFINIIEG